MPPKKKHGIITSNKKIDEIHGFQPLSLRELSNIQDLKEIILKTDGGDLLWTILINNLDDFEKPNSKMAKFINFKAQTMAEFFVKPYTLPEPWKFLVVSYTNVILGLLIEGLWNMNYRASNGGIERRRKDQQILHHIEMNHFYSEIIKSRESDSYLYLERYCLGLLEKMYPKTKPDSFLRDDICVKMRTVYWPREYLNTMLNSPIPNIDDDEFYEDSAKGKHAYIQL